MEWREKVEAAAAQLTVPGLAVSQPAIEVVTEAVEIIDQRYGPESEDYLTFHNGDHAIDVAGRNMRVLSLLHPYINLEKWGDGIADRSFIAAGGHDIRRLLGSGQDERASVVETSALIDKKASEMDRPIWKDVEKFKLQVGRIIMTTQVEVKENGEFAQVNLAVGDHDPAKFDLAFADINGIAMEGVERMTRDSLNLYVELNKPNLTPKGVADFLCTQEEFIRYRLHKNRVQSDLAYFFPDEAMMATYEVLRAEFEDNIIEASTHAKRIRRHPEVFEALAASLLKMGGLLSSPSEAAALLANG